MRLVRVEYDPPGRFLSEQYGVLALGPDGDQVLFVHAHMAQHGPLPWIRRVVDAETGETIKVSGSWLGGDHEAALQRTER